MPYRTEPGRSGRRGRTGAVRCGAVRYGTDTSGSVNGFMDCACVLGTTVTFVPYNVALIKERSSSTRYRPGWPSGAMQKRQN